MVRTEKIVGVVIPVGDDGYCNFNIRRPVLTARRDNGQVVTIKEFFTSPDKTAAEAEVGKLRGIDVETVITHSGSEYSVYAALKSPTKEDIIYREA